MLAKKTLRTLRFFRITDADDNLSLTNLCLVVMLVMMVRRPEVSLVDMGTLMASIAGYQFKRWLTPTPENESEVESLKAALGSLETKVAALGLGNAMRKK